ncbi:phosphatidylinositol-specific phospholipase C domain-containing protein [Leptospira ilyithenensis]|uniref:phosphatidylinositol-specific phospholipase C domain-containing protein n=1 Tax=Leptospira ilyithenensis TaxID=2484901 RepID=UPI001AF01249|nr:phosphatidylinositol-specific phospholipase C domain-containing protein [Leptospira ilyithenensis]
MAAGKIAGSGSIADISIPGTHDSGTYKCYQVGFSFLNFICAQTWSIEEQLNAGVRFLDIRLEQSSETAIQVNHGSHYCHIGLEDVLNQCYAFLAKNPGEYIIMSLKKDYGDNSRFTNNLGTVLQNNYITPAAKSWYTQSTIPTVTNAQGKIVLFNRMNYLNGQGIAALPANWPDNSEYFSINNTGYNIYVQDLYNPWFITSKLEAIDNLFQLSNKKDGNFYLNFFSWFAKTGRWAFPTSPYSGSLSVGVTAIIVDGTTVEIPIDPLSVIQKYAGNKMGIVILNFPTKDQINAIINTNG